MRVYVSLLACSHGQAAGVSCVAAAAAGGTKTVLTADIGGTNARFQVHAISTAGAAVLAFEKARLLNTKGE